ncbi:MAG: GNAT family N-acetyltransferase [Bacteroidetes bacterium]|nr:GNAT family N-acetyltransferase [Bacteroidota bacterium]
MEIRYRIATETDIPSLAGLRALTRGTVEGWAPYIAGYMEGINNPQKALAPRAVYAAMDDEKVVGWIAGHLTKRLGCDGELQWIDVAPEYRRKGIASELVKLLAGWFAGQNASKICVDPGNDDSRKFYAANGAENLNQHWMYWEDITILVE